MLRIFNSMQYIEWENGVRRMRHRKLIQVLSLHAFYAERTEILKAKGRLRNTSRYKDAYITQDYAKAIQIIRKVLIKAMFLARKRGMNAKVVDRNLIVNNVYNVDNIPENLKESL